MATEYRVNIQLNTEKVKADLKTIKTEIDKLGRVNISTNQKAQRVEARIAKSKDAQRAAMVETRRIGDLVQKAADQGLKVDKARRAINKAALADGRQDFKTAKAQQKVALEELKIQRAITKEKAQQARLSGRSMAGGPSTLAGIASSRFGSVREPGSPRFIASRIGMVQGPQPASVDVKPSGPISSLTRLTANTPLGLSGVEAFPITRDLGTFGPKKPFIGQTTGFGRSPVLGRPDQPGSQRNILRVAKENTMPIGGFSFMPDSPKGKKFLANQQARQQQLDELDLQRKLGEMEEKSAKFRKQAVLDRKKSLSLGKDIVRIKTKEAKAEAKEFDKQIRRNAPSESLNFDRRGNLLPGPAGSRQRGSGLLRTLARNRGSALQSAAISGAFPLLFGQGPLAALGGGLGGGLGGAFGGQMGGFAGGLIGTAVVSGIQGFTSSISQLGQAINSVNKDTTPLIQALGLTGTEYEKQIKTLESLGDQEAAFDLVRQKMTQQVGADGVKALSNFGDQTKKLSSSFGTFMLNMRVGLANLIEQAGILRALARTAETGVAFERAKELAKTDTDVAALVTKFQNVGNEGLLQNLKKAVTGEKGGFTGQEQKNLILDELTALIKKKETDKEIKLLNDAVNKAAQKKLTTDIELLEKSKEKGHLSALEFEIEEKLQEMRDKKLDINEKDFADKMRKLDALRKERELMLQIEQSAKDMAETIATDLGNGIKELIRGTSTLNDVMRNVLDKMIDAALNMAIFGNAGGSFMPGVGLLGSIFKAEGGPVKRGGSFIVGERGPELFTPGVSGMITPNHALGGSTSVVVNVDASGSSVEGDEQGGRELGLVLSAAIESELIKQKRPGGLLA